MSICKGICDISYKNLTSIQKIQQECSIGFKKANKLLKSLVFKGLFCPHAVMLVKIGDFTLISVIFIVRPIA